MPNDLLILAFMAWSGAALLTGFGRGLRVARMLLAGGAGAAILAALLALPAGTVAVALPGGLAGETIGFQLSGDALWLMGFGLVPAIMACWLSTPARAREAGWLFGVAASLIGALGVFGIRNAAGFLIAWEIMSLGGAAMILSEKLSGDAGRPVLFMLGLLETGAVALMAAVLLMGVASGSFTFDAFAAAAPGLSPGIAITVAVLLVVGFGAKLGLLPFYEWFPQSYGSGSGASGAILSGVVVNAAFYGLNRGLLEWAPAGHAGAATGVGILVVIIGVASAILTALYAFQQEDWRKLLSFSSAENAAIAVTMLGAALMFRGHGEARLASLAWIVALIHLAGHCLAKGGLFLTADGVFRATGGYAIAHSGLLRRSSWLFGLGTLFCAMSLAAMPPQAGFVSEWYVFQTVFQGFHLGSLVSRLVMALAGAGLALTVAVAFATIVKVFGVGLLGRTAHRPAAVSPADAMAVGVLGLGVLGLAAGMPLWLAALGTAATTQFGTAAAAAMHDGPILVPLTASFAFISPSLLVVVTPLLALLPIVLVLVARRRYGVRRVPVWYGGLDHDPERASTTALTFSNAMRTFYSFIYRPREETRRQSHTLPYFVNRLEFSHAVAPVFGPWLFAPVTNAVLTLATRLKVLQSGHLNIYLAFIGGLLVVILALVLA